MSAPQIVKDIIRERVAFIEARQREFRNSHEQYVSLQAQLDELSQWLVDDFNEKGGN